MIPCPPHGTHLPFTGRGLCVQLRSIFSYMRSDRQTLLFSATWPIEVQLLAEGLLAPSHVMVEVGGALAASGRANDAIQQKLLLCEAETKLKTLIKLLEELMDGSRILVFASSKRRCDELTRELRIDGWCVIQHSSTPSARVYTPALVMALTACCTPSLTWIFASISSLAGLL